MVILRCTQRLLRRLHQTPTENPPASSTTLGDWYGNIVWTHRKPLVLAVSSRTLLPVLVPAGDAQSLGRRLAATLGDVLQALGILTLQVEQEQRHMSQIAFARTVSRQVLGTMN